MYKAGVGPIFGAPYSDKHRTVVAAAAAAAVAVVAAALFNLVVVRPYSRIEQDNSKPQNNNRWTQNVCIERILYTLCPEKSSHL